MDDDDFLASLEAYERRGHRARASVAEPQYIPPPLAAKLARLSGSPPPEPPPVLSPQERWEKSQSEYKEMKASSGKWRPARKVWAVTEEPVSPPSPTAVATPLPASPRASNSNSNGNGSIAMTPLQARLSVVEDPLVSPELEEQGWLETRLRWGDALIEPHSVISGFAPLALHRGSGGAAKMKLATSDDAHDDASKGSPDCQTMSNDELEMLTQSPRKLARHSDAEHRQLVAAYLANMAATFYQQSSCGVRLVKHSRYGFAKVKLVKLNHETGVLSWGSGDISVRDMISMKLHRFSGDRQTLPANAAAASSTAAAVLAAASLSPRKDDVAPFASPSPSALSPSPAAAAAVAGSASPKAFKASATSPLSSPTAGPPPPATPKGHFLFTIHTASRSLQLDAPTAFDRELWLLGLFNFHRGFVVDAAEPGPDGQRPPPITTINFDVLPSGEMRIHLHKDSAPHTPANSPTQAAAASAAAAAPTAAASPAASNSASPVTAATSASSLSSPLSSPKLAASQGSPSGSGSSSVHLEPFDLHGEASFPWWHQQQQRKKGSDYKMYFESLDADAHE